MRKEKVRDLIGCRVKAFYDNYLCVVIGNPSTRSPRYIVMMEDPKTTYGWIMGDEEIWYFQDESLRHYRGRRCSCLYEGDFELLNTPLGNNFNESNKERN